MLEGAATEGTRPLVGRVSAGVLFGSAIGLSAFLLFSVQPLVGRIALPVFGGTPAVWATVLFFFQGVLLLGYLYGHASVTRLGVRRGAVLHVGVALLALVALALAPERVGDIRDLSRVEVLSLLVMLLALVGLPAFLLTTTTPVMSAWYRSVSARSGEARDPYWLYALSNTGSLAALLAYPLLVEPRIGLFAQRELWAVAFAVFVAVLVACAWLVRTPPAAAGGVAAAIDRAGRVATQISWKRRGRWLLLAAVPSGLLSAVTTFIATDLVSAPLLWIGPLSLYLVSFIVAFSDRGRRFVPRATILAPAAITLLWVPYGSSAGWPILPLVLMILGAFAVVATALHGNLALDRPDPSRLTEFYLIISAGGVLASAFVAVAAPMLFPSVWELPILLVLGLAALATVPSGGSGLRTEPGRRGLDFRPFFAGGVGRVGPYAIVAIAVGTLLVAQDALATQAAIRWLAVGGLLLIVGARPAFLAVSTALVLSLSVFVVQQPAVFRDRSFFGVTEVVRDDAAGVVRLRHGTTVHGTQFLDAAARRTPMAYYARSGPFGDLFRLVDERYPDRARVAVAGLGAGGLTAYSRAGLAMTYFEIDPMVIEVASNPSYFTYLSDANPRPEIVLGDARLSLEAAADRSFEVLILDAFSSDTIPTHLLTTEAIADYLRVLEPDGLLAVHISNRYYDLGPAIAAGAARFGLTAYDRTYAPSDAEARAGASLTRVLAIGSREALRPLVSTGWNELQSGVEPLTDDFSDVLRFLILGSD